MPVTLRNCVVAWWVPRRGVYRTARKVKTGDQPWFGFQCRKAADNKSKAWLRYKSHPTRRHKHQHKMACENMKRAQKEAINNWRDHLKRMLTGQSVGTKDWWSSIKQQQGFSRDDSIPPLTAPDGSVVTSHRGKAQGVGTLYKSQVRSRMENSPLAWSSCPPSYLGLLDRVQARTQRLARLKAPEAAAQIIQPLQQRRDVAGMCVMYKAHRMQLLQLAELRLNPRARPPPLYPCGPQHRPSSDCALREDGTLPPLLPTPLWSTLEHLGAPDRPAPHHFHARLQIGHVGHKCLREVNCCFAFRDPPARRPLRPRSILDTSCPELLGTQPLIHRETAASPPIPPMARWAEYFGQLFTVDPPTEQLHTTGLQAVDADPPIDETATSLDEVREAVAKLRSEARVHLAPSLLNACMDWVLDKVVDQSDCGASVGNTKITDLVFVDDAVIFAESLEVLVMALEALREEAKPLDLRSPGLRPRILCEYQNVSSKLPHSMLVFYAALLLLVLGERGHHQSTVHHHHLHQDPRPRPQDE
ncbi:hypothetical protein GWK47_034802 [Chionoecetes opilio]|uniref:Reverse transcriptase domain-containing protein n=1 Tax=Chionoecetes opilio TaxID=41210 RepID=A0A8J5D3G6_CHIOP|nr:hypothetical protein GWK47_034802 [Chionoecetes opilio]